MEKMQRSMYSQLTGHDLPGDFMSKGEDEKQETLKQAFCGKKVLLALDDLWELSPPTVEESMQILLAAAELSAEAAAKHHDDAIKIIELCNRLPLALVMAGRLIVQLDIGSAASWEGISSILEDELRDNEHAQTEQLVIKASLAGLRGSERDKTGVKNLFSLFALVPEDTVCPLETLMLMYDSCFGSDGGSRVSLLHIRKWLKVLIDRSLVLGHVDQASLHDLVLDFTLTLHSAERLVEMHRNVVERFRAARTVNGAGVARWTVENRDDAMTYYVLNECEHHVRNAEVINKNGVMEESLLSWLCDQPLDVIGTATAKVIGEDRVSELAAAAEDAGKYYVAAGRWLAAGSVANLLRGKAAYADMCRKCFACLEKLSHIDGDDPAGVFTKDEKDHMETDAVRNIAMGLDPDDLDNIADRLNYLLGAKATLARPEDACGLLFFQKCMPGINSGEMVKMAEAFVYTFLPYTMKNGILGSPDKSTREFCRVIFIQSAGLLGEMAILAPNFSWDNLYGVGGAYLRKGLQIFDYDRFHSRLIEWANGDYYTGGPGVIGPMLLHWGDLAAAHEAADKGFDNIRKLINEPNQAPEAFCKCTFFGGHVIVMMHLLGRSRDMAKVMAEAGATWSGAEAFVQQEGMDAFISKVGDAEAASFVSGESVMWAVMIGNVL
eukprot:SAG31_NODE_5973_length_2232_cov_1.170183_1_plen_664_part_01